MFKIRQNFSQCFLVLILTTSCDTARILAFFPIPSRSHHFFVQPTLHELSRRGHQVDYYSPVEMRIEHSNVTRIPVEDYASTLFNASRNVTNKWYGFLFLKNDREILHWADVSLALNEKLGESSAVQRLLQSSTKYDLLIHEGLLVFEVGHVFAHKFNIPSVNILPIRDAFTINHFTGLVTNPAYMVSGLSRFTDRMTFFNRLENFYSFVTTVVAYHPYLNHIQAIADQHYTYPGWETRPSMGKLMSDQALVLANGHPSVGYSYPKPPHFIEIGGAVLQSENPLPKDLDDFMNGANDGVIYFSLGTIIDIANVNLKNTFASVFSRRKERVLWKNNEPPSNVSDNIKFSKFFPQQSVLAHKNVKLFITHAGLQSSFESVHFAVPMLMIPFVGDQAKNALGLTQAGYGLTLDKENLTEASLDWAIDEMTRQSKYKNSVLKGSAALRDRPMSPTDEAVYWIEYVLRHGKVLQPVGAQLSALELYCLDIYAFNILIFIVLLYTVKRVFILIKTFFIVKQEKKYKKK